MQHSLEMLSSCFTQQIDSISSLQLAKRRQKSCAEEESKGKSSIIFRLVAHRARY